MAGVRLRLPFSLTITDSTNIIPFLIVPGNNHRLNVRSIYISTFDSSGTKGAAEVEQCFFSDDGTGYSETGTYPLELEDDQYAGTLDVESLCDDSFTVLPTLDRIIGKSIIAANNVSEIFSALNEKDGLSIPGGNGSGTGKHRFGLRFRKDGDSGNLEIHGYIRLEY